MPMPQNRYFTLILQLMRARLAAPTALCMFTSPIGYAMAAVWSIDILTLGFRKSIKNLGDPIFNVCQFPLQSTNLQKTGCYFTEVSAHQFIDVAAPGALITVPKYVSNRLFRGAKALGHLVILQTTCDEEHRLELHRLQEICQGRRVDGVQGIGSYG